MFPFVNGKSFLELNEEDLEYLIDNPDFRENEYIDYKEDFAFLEFRKINKPLYDSKIAEFRNDVCSFANAEGGYLIYGISDEKGCAKDVVGVEIDNNNTDKFELDRRTNLYAIRPRCPYLKFHFIKLKNNRYVIVIFVKHDSFAPYLHIEGDNTYRAYKRYGNGKKTMQYTELKNMFIQSVSLDKEISNYRSERIEYYQAQQEGSENSIYSKFLLLHIIPETFLDSSYDRNMYILEKSSEKKFGYIFEPVSCSFSVPCVSGLRFPPICEQSICYLNNNGIAECFLSLVDSYLNHHVNGFTRIDYEYAWGKASEICKRYVEIFKEGYADQRIYISISLVGCKGLCNAFDFSSNSIIDRDIIMCSPFPIDVNDENVDIVLKKIKIDLLLSIGIKSNMELNSLVKEVYHV